MKRLRLIILSHVERAELNRHVKDAMEARLIRPNHIEFDSHKELGSTLFASRIHFLVTKVEVVADMPMPMTQKEVRSFAQF
jgi:hypothetical protein